MKRIFWLGAHKLLVKTELARLRSLGYEVFNTPYNTPVPDQSANRNWDSNQKTTLPKDVFDKLAHYNFFYNSVSDDIGHILNTYFDAVVVTIHPWWLSEIMRVYTGKILYRTYGQNEILSAELTHYEAITRIQNRKNFYFLPFHEATIRDEDDWLKSKATVVPYCLDPDILERQDQWKASDPKNQKVMVTCPNINNPFYLDHYKYLKKNFFEDTYRFFGVQLSKIPDPQIMGTIPYSELTLFFKQAVGFMYTYKNPRVCYLPPIEMMFVGGPVIYPEGCLLDRMIGTKVGSFKDEAEAKALVRRLLENDQILIKQLQDQQKKIVDYYHPNFVWSVFDKVMVELIEKPEVDESRGQLSNDKRQKTLVFENYEKVREHLIKHLETDDKIFCKQDIIENYFWFRAERHLRIRNVSQNVVNFSKRIERGEFIQELLRTEPQLTKDLPAPTLGPQNKHFKQLKYIVLRLRDRSGLVSVYHESKRVIIRLKQKLKSLCIHLTFKFWLVTNKTFDRHTNFEIK